MSNGEIFLVDSNSFITPARLYYAPQFFPSFWDFMGENLQNGKMVILDSVYAELTRGEKRKENGVDVIKYDDLAMWLKAIPNLTPLSHKQKSIVAGYAAIQQYITDCGFYLPNVQNTWRDESVADPWLVATAKVFGYTIISFEKPLNPQPGSKYKAIKIPDVCSVFQVKYGDLFYMMKKLGFRERNIHA
jgi:hypothetical protein